MLSSFVPACISREFTTWATNRTSPVVEWLRALAGHEHERCGGPGRRRHRDVLHGRLRAGDGDASEPARAGALPTLDADGDHRAQRRSIDCSPADLDIVKQRCAREGLSILGLRFTSDRFVPDERFAYLRSNSARRSSPSSWTDEAANPDAVMKPHSVVTEHLIDEPGQPTRAALDQVLDLFRSRLLT